MTAYRHSGTNCRSIFKDQESQKKASNPRKWFTLGRVWAVANWLATCYAELITTHINHVLGLTALFLDSRPLKMELIGCPETSVSNYHYSLRNNSEKRNCQYELRALTTQCSKRFFFRTTATASTFVVTESRKWKTDSCNSLMMTYVQETPIFRNKEVTLNKQRNCQYPLK